VASPASAQDLPLCQFATQDEVRNGQCEVGDVGADGETVIVADGPNYTETEPVAG
jgi:hypothetical protein